MNKNRVKINKEIESHVALVMEKELKKMDDKLQFTLDDRLQMIVSSIDSITAAVKQNYHLTRAAGMQLETLVRLINKGIPDFRQNFEAEFTKTQNLVSFLDKLNHPGELSSHHIKEKIKYARDWNSKEENVPVIGFMFGLDKELIENKNNEFSQEEIQDLRKEFSIV